MVQILGLAAAPGYVGITWMEKSLRWILTSRGVLHDGGVGIWVLVILWILIRVVRIWKVLGWCLCGIPLKLLKLLREIKRFASGRIR